MGDPHAQLSNLDDLDKVIGLLLDEAKKHDVKTLVIAGDLFHTHGVLRLEVVNFWQNNLELMSNYFTDIIALVGNHDMTGDRQKEGKMSALDVLKTKNLTVVSSPKTIGGLALIPYMSDHEKFIESCNNLPDSEFLICHQTFDGSMFENGFYAPSGIDQSKITKHKKILSGHIHKTQEIGRVFYPGTPKWDSASDANEDKGIWVFKGEKRIFCSSSSVIEPLRKIEITPETDLSKLVAGKRTTLEFVGPSTWIAQVSKKYKGECKISAKPTDSIERRAKKAQHSTIFDFLKEYDGASMKDEVRSYLEGLV